MIRLYGSCYVSVLAAVAPVLLSAEVPGTPLCLLTTHSLSHRCCFFELWTGRGENRTKYYVHVVTRRTNQQTTITNRSWLASNPFFLQQIPTVINDTLKLRRNWHVNTRLINRRLSGHSSSDSRTTTVYNSRQPRGQIRQSCDGTALKTRGAKFRHCCRRRKQEWVKTCLRGKRWWNQALDWSFMNGGHCMTTFM